MPVFQPSVSLSQSADGSIVVITDTSNYSDNSDSVTLGNIGERTDTITDGLGNDIETITFAPSSLTAEITITKDYYLHNVLSFTLAGGSVRTGTENALMDNFYNNVAREVSRKLRCCTCHKLCNAAVKADLAHSESVTATLFNVPSEAQNAIDDANTLINSEECGC
jgi:hypothetical protein